MRIELAWILDGTMSLPGISSSAIQAATILNLNMDGWWTLIAADGSLGKPNSDVGVGTMSLAPFSLTTNANTVRG